MRFTEEQYNSYLRKLSTYSFIKHYKDATHTRNGFEIVINSVGLVDCKELIDFSIKNDLNYVFLPLSGKITVMFWPYKHT